MVKSLINICLLLLVAFGSSCGNEPVEKDYSQENVISYGDLDVLKTSVKPIVPDLSLGSLLAGSFAEASIESLGDLNASDWKALVEKTLATSDAETCLSALTIPLRHQFDQTLEAACFSPEITYDAHPDTTEPGIIPKGYSGIWWDHADIDFNKGEACGAQLLNKSSSAKLERFRFGIGITAAVSCLARVNRVALPELNETTNLLETFDLNLFKNLSINFEELTLEVELSESSGQVAYRVSSKGTVEATESSMDFTLTHAHDHSETTTNKGFLVAQFSLSETSLLFSANYQSQGSGINFSSREATVPSADTEIYLPAGAESLSTEAFGKGLFWQDMEIRYGETSAIQALRIESFPRNQVLKTILQSNADSDSETEVAQFFFGHQDAMTYDLENIYSIDGMVCFPDADNGDIFYPGVQNQTLARDRISGKFHPTNTKTVFAPTNTCDVSFVVGFPGKSGSITKIVNGPITNNLLETEEYEDLWRAASDASTLPQN
ncbi:MAG: hypothetical protein HRU19_06450 [Pseudobacteriovorax sp.]|nr:hypothetical protein [Pseudobacteriovorax sp.]